MRLFCILNLRSMRKHYKLIILNIASFIVSIAMLSTVFMLNESKASFAKNDGKFLNHGDMSVYFLTTNDAGYSVDDYQLMREFNKWFYEYIRGINGIEFTYEQIQFGQTLSSVCYVKPDTLVSIAPLFCFVDFDEIDLYVKGLNPETVSKDAVILSELGASRMNADVGDFFHYSRGVTEPIVSYEVAGTCPDIGLNYDIFGTMTGYMYFDRSKLTEVAGARWNTEELNHELITFFYINGDKETLRTIEGGARERAVSLGFTKDIFVSYADNMRGIVDGATRLFNAVLSFFTIICTITSAFTIFQLLQMRLFNRRKELAVLKVIGLNNKRGTAYSVLELLMCTLPAVVIGIIVGLFVIRPISVEIPLFNLDFFGVKEFVISVLKVIVSIALLVTVIAVPLLYFVNSRNIQDVLRKQAVPILRKRTLVFVILLCAAFIIVLFSFFSGLLYSVILVAGACVIFGLIAIICKLFILLLGVIRARAYMLICVRYLRRNNTRVLFSIATTTICLVLFLSAVTIIGTTANQLNRKMIRDYDYNFISEVSADSREGFEAFLSESGIDYTTAFSLMDIRVEDEVKRPDFSNNAGRTLCVYYRIPDRPAYNPLNEGATIGLGVRGRYAKFTGDDITLTIGEESLTIPITNMGKVFFRTHNNEVAVHADFLPDKTLLESLTKHYYFNIPQEKQLAVMEYAAGQRGINARNGAQSALDDMNMFSKYVYIFKVFMVFFLFGVVILVLSCQLINYSGRVREFSVYEAYGATKATRVKIVLWENIMTAIISALATLALAYPITGFMSMMFTGGYMEISLPFAVLTSAIAFVIQLAGAIVTINTTGFVSVSAVLRTAD